MSAELLVTPAAGAYFQREALPYAKGLNISEATFQRNSKDHSLFHYQCAAVKLTEV